ncbi:hypothetical protein [Amycolatopsis sp. cmx-11-12]|uniref:hypothetical protein n=1 Tax=Amycolatopsis sp. cmx-11-12 TaxID=2785795 RepID=UPI003916DB8D
MTERQCGEGDGESGELPAGEGLAEHKEPGGRGERPDLDDKLWPADSPHSADPANRAA